MDVKLSATLVGIVLCTTLAAPARATESNPFIDGTVAGHLQLRVLERCHQAFAPPALPRETAVQNLKRISSPEPPGTDPDPLLPPSCTGSCRSRAKLARMTMRLLVELARGISH
jgi:hypothetical protein